MRRTVMAVAALAGTLVLAGPAAAADYTVSRSADPPGETCSGPEDTGCTLRSALEHATEQPGDDTIALTATDPYRLDEGQLEITAPDGGIVIAGRGVRVTTLTGLDEHRALDVDAAGLAAVEVRDLSIEDTVAPAGEDGGAVRSTGSSFGLRRVVIDGSRDDGTGGAVVLVDSVAGIGGSSILDTSGALDGGNAVVARGALVAMSNTTLADGAGGLAVETSGSGTDATVTGRELTIAGNRRGIRLGSDASSLRLARTIVDQGALGCSRPVTDEGGNLDAGTSCFSAASGSIVGEPARLGEARRTFAGGPPVRAPLPGSPAIDAAPDADCVAADSNMMKTPGQDARARAGLRPTDGNGDGVARCDIGAVEYQPARLLSGAVTSESTTQAAVAFGVANGDAPALVRVEYGLTPAYGSVTEPTDVAFRISQTEGSLRFGGLRPGTTYHYRVVLGDGTSTLATGPDQTFRTEGDAPGGGQAPGGSGSAPPGSGGGAAAPLALRTSLGKVPRLKLDRNATRRGLPIRVTCSAACRIAARLTTTRKLGKRLKVKSGRLARVSATGEAGRPRTVRLRLSRKLVRRVRRAEVKSLTLSVTTTPVGGGAPVTTTRKVTLAR